MREAYKPSPPMGAAALRDEPKWPKPSVPQPSWSGVRDMSLGLSLEPCLATDGCEIELDGVCEHGHPAWPLYLGVL